MKKILTFLFSLTLLFSFLLPFSSVKALSTCSDETDPLGFNCLDDSGLGRTDPRVMASRIINISLSLLGTIFVVLTVYAGFLWMTAGGNDDQVGKAKNILYASIIGLLIILSAYSISNFVLKNLYSASTGDNYGNVLD
ncbi:MAG: hypothetical protein WC414_03870 [Patescibacteria group bacterium]